MLENMRTLLAFDKALSMIKAYNRIIIHRHKNPDGDALGSQTGLKYIITANFPDKEVYIVGDGSKRYGFIEGCTPDEIPDSMYEGALSVVLDTAAAALISDGRYTLAASSLRFDHHLFCEKICEAEIIDSSYESCCGLVTQFAIECGLKVPETAAKALYTGLITDSGRFRYDSTTPRTFKLAEFLLENGVTTADIYAELYADDLSSIQLRAKFALKIKISDGGVAYIYTTLDEMKQLQADPFSISRGMVGTMSDLRGVHAWVNFTETEQGVLCEIRSGKYNINPVAVLHGGGGHAKASGATLKDYNEAMTVIKELELLRKGLI